MNGDHGFATGRFAPDSWQVVEWAPAEGQPAREVHLVLTYGPDTIVVRLPSRAVVGELISALAGARARVWPQQLVPAGSLPGLEVVEDLGHGWRIERRARPAEEASDPQGGRCADQ